MHSMDSDSDDLFNKYIEVESGESEGEMEMKSVQPQRKSRIKKRQMDKITSVMKEHKEENLDKSRLNELWVNLTPDLNELGPPSHEISVWKTKWTEHKSKLKLRGSSKAFHISEDTSSQAGDPSTTDKLPTKYADDTGDAYDETTNIKNFFSEALKKFSATIDVLIEQQRNSNTKVLERLDLILVEVRKTNEMMEAIFSKK